MKQEYIYLSLATAFACLLFSVMPSSADDSDINSVEAIEFGATDVEIHLKSSRPFPVRAIPPVLQIGPTKFNRSLRTRNGDLNRLIFLLLPKEFAHLQTGEPMSVVYGLGVSTRERWNFGTFAK